MYLYLYSYRRETARQLRMYAQLTRCFSAVAELLVVYKFDPEILTGFPEPGHRTRMGWRSAIKMCCLTTLSCSIMHVQ